jgi:hypothetical protein
MDVKRKIPHEGVKVTDDGLAVVPDGVTDDTEGHATIDGVVNDLTVNPGTGGDIAPRRPSTGGEFIDENDVEGHVVTEFLPGTGTGGDFAPSRRPSTGGEFIDENDVEGHVVI